MKALLTAAALVLGTSMMKASELDDWRWKKRILVLYAPAGTNEQLAEQQARLQQVAEGVAERDLQLLVLRRRADAPDAARRLRLDGGRFTVVLVGKDGGVKLRAQEVVPPEKLFRLIDSMPMRQEEMQQN